MDVKKGRVLARASRFLRVFFLTRQERRYLKAAKASKLFDPVYYRGAYPGIHELFMRVPLRHYIVYGEAVGFRPNPDFSPSAYLRYNPDVAEVGVPPFYHYVLGGHKEARVCKELPKVEELPQVESAVSRFDAGRKIKRFVVVAHIYYPDLWPEFAKRFSSISIDYDLYITLTYRGSKTDKLIKKIRKKFPDAIVVPLENR